MQTKLFLLLQTEQYSAALTLTDSTDHAFEFGRSYALYRLHREHEAAAVLDEIKSTAGMSRGVNHLEAQLVRPNTSPRPHFLYLRASFYRTIDKAPIRQRSICIMTSSTRLKQCVSTSSIHTVRLRFTRRMSAAIRRTGRYSHKP